MISPQAITIKLQRHNLVLLDEGNGQELIEGVRRNGRTLVLIVSLILLVFLEYLSFAYLPQLGRLLRRVLWLVLIIPIAYLVGRLYQEVKVNQRNRIKLRFGKGRLTLERKEESITFYAGDTFQFLNEVVKGSEDVYIGTLSIVSRGKKLELIHVQGDKRQELLNDLTAFTEYINGRMMDAT